MRVLRLAAGLSLALAALVAATSLADRLRLSVSELRGLAFAAVLAASVTLTFAAFPVKVLKRAAIAALRPRQRDAIDIERTLHVLIYAGTALVAAGLLHGALQLPRALGPEQVSWAAVLAGPAVSLVARLAVIEPLKSLVRLRLVRARQS